VEKQLEDEDEDKEDEVVVDGEEDATFARPNPYKRSTANPRRRCEGLTGRIGVNCDALKHLLTFHHNTFFPLLFILENAYKTSFFLIKNGRMFQIRSPISTMSQRQHPSIHPCTHTSIHPSFHPSIHPSTHTQTQTHTQRM
jgi:hypothetical protein